MYKIHFESKTLVLGHPVEPLPEPADPTTRLELVTKQNSSALSQALRHLQDPAVQQVVLRDDDPDALLRALETDYAVLRAAGGFVHTPDGKVLLIFRRGKWDLPKGKLDDGESLEQCALREIGEETGATGLTIESSLLVTRHTYAEKGKPLLKESHWFLVKSPGETQLTPQENEDIERCVWGDLNDLGNYLDNTHGSIIDVVDAALIRLNR
jgi:8-oxo-dGTP pyrophosphatase MutT (NUDIX family)